MLALLTWKLQEDNHPSVGSSVSHSMVLQFALCSIVFVWFCSFVLEIRGFQCFNTS